MTYSAKAPNRYWGATTPPTSKAEFFNAITSPPASGTGTVATIRMYGPIDSWGGYWGISTADVGAVLDALPDTVDQIVLRINSPGGEVFEALSILNMLRAHQAKVTAVIDGLAASAASVIAAGCDETVMSPGTQMMIHSPLIFSYGNAVELRSTAAVLDGIQDSLIEIYQGKAGDADWADILAAETWYTAAQAVEQGLADRVAVVPDAGDAETIGAEPTSLPDPADTGDVEDFYNRARAVLARQSTPKPPVSTEPGAPTREENAVSHSSLTAGLRERLGVTDADASDETLLAALDEALAEQVDTPPAPAATIPAGAIVVDAAAHDELQRNAAAGRRALDALNAQRRDQIIDSALADGRIAAASRDSWRAQLDVDEGGISALLDSFPTNSVPVQEIGHSDTVMAADDALYSSAWGADEKGH